MYVDDAKCVVILNCTRVVLVQSVENQASTVGQLYVACFGSGSVLTDSLYQDPPLNGPNPVAV